MMSSGWPIRQKSPSQHLYEEQHSPTSFPLRLQASPYSSAAKTADALPRQRYDMSRNQECGLFDAIDAKLKWSVFSKKRFLPKNEFEALLTESNIKEALHKAAPGAYDHSLVEYITKHARKTFATLVWEDKVQKAINLDTYGFRDDYLPINIEEKDVTSLNGISGITDPLSWFYDWSQREISKFRDAQWLFMPFDFANKSAMEDLHRDCPLPFLTCDSKGEGGSFSLLHQATIHQAHQNVSEVRISSSNLFIHAHMYRTILSSQSSNYAIRLLELLKVSSQL
jgi:hypothetical protein